MRLQASTELVSTNFLSISLPVSMHLAVKTDPSLRVLKSSSSREATIGYRGLRSRGLEIFSIEQGAYMPCPERKDAVSVMLFSSILESLQAVRRKPHLGNGVITVVCLYELA